MDCLPYLVLFHLGFFINLFCCQKIICKKIDAKYNTTYNIDRELFRMSKWDKLLTRICTLSKDIRFDELRKVLECCGYEMNAPRSGSSHYTLRKKRV